MKYVQTNSDFPYRVNYMVNGEPVIPSSAKISVLDQSGGYPGNIVEATLDVTSTGTTYVILSSANQRNSDYDIRYIVVQFTYNSVVYTMQDMYALQDSMRLPVTPNDVRALLSMNSTELPDESIDLFSAYAQFQNDLGTDVNLTTLLNSGSALIPNIMRGIAAYAALNSTVAIELMLYQSEQADNTLYTRFAKLDFESILARLRGLIADALGEVGATTITDITIFRVFTDTDPVTGA